jgi:hypothetical protein
MLQTDVRLVAAALSPLPIGQWHTLFTRRLFAYIRRQPILDIFLVSLGGYLPAQTLSLMLVRFRSGFVMTGFTGYDETRRGASVDSILSMLDDNVVSQSLFAGEFTTQRQSDRFSRQDLDA